MMANKGWAPKRKRKKKWKARIDNIVRDSVAVERIFNDGQSLWSLGVSAALDLAAGDAIINAPCVSSRRTSPGIVRLLYLHI